MSKPETTLIYCLIIRGWFDHGVNQHSKQCVKETLINFSNFGLEKTATVSDISYISLISHITFNRL